ncbi:MAG: L-2-hydroxyglutarate oxidase [Desulfobacterales bacterium]|jgi:L-2-hydroxyglutarate oxidase
MAYDYLIVGGGIVGISTAWQLLQRYPNKRILVLEKESQYAGHQTGHNSGVIHAGVYYQPGSLKADFCRRGNEATIKFCLEHDIPYEQCGKLLVATNQNEYYLMEKLFERAKENQIEVEWLDRKQLKKREPNISGLGAFFVPQTGIVNYRKITNKMAELFKARGGEVRLGCEVLGLDEKSDGVRVRTYLAEFQTRYLIACSGLMADRLVKMLGIQPDFQIIPFRGEYFQLPPHKNNIINHLIYPIPDPEMPFLGVHLTRMIDGTVTVGPNAVLGFKREGYRKTDVSFRDLKEMATFSGFWKVMQQNLKAGLSEFKNSIFKGVYLELVRKYCPQVTLSDLTPYPAGVRAQAVAKDGTLIHDFLFVDTQRTFHVCNAPSPAATSAIPIGAHIVERVEEIFG